MTYNLDEPCLCPRCDNPMEVQLPIWITPGSKRVDTGEIDYESSMPTEQRNWWCENCNRHIMPKAQV
jgi:hypothetical protein